MGSEKNLSESLRYIYEHKGIDTFLNEKIMYSILSDLMPRNTKEINWVIDAINSGAVKPLIEAEKNNFNKEEYKQKARRVFEGNEISESRINYLLNSFFYGLKWTDKIISFEEIKQKEKISQNNIMNRQKMLRKTIKKIMIKKRFMIKINTLTIIEKILINKDLTKVR